MKNHILLFLSIFFASALTAQKIGIYAEITPVGKNKLFSKITWNKVNISNNDITYFGKVDGKEVEAVYSYDKKNDILSIKTISGSKIFELVCEKNNYCRILKNGNEISKNGKINDKFQLKVNKSEKSWATAIIAMSYLPHESKLLSPSSIVPGSSSPLFSSTILFPEIHAKIEKQPCQKVTKIICGKPCQAKVNEKGEPVCGCSMCDLVCCESGCEIVKLEEDCKGAGSIEIGINF